MRNWADRSWELRGGRGSCEFSPNPGWTGTVLCKEEQGWLPGCRANQDWLLALRPALRKMLRQGQGNRGTFLLLMYFSLQRAFALQTRGFFWKEHIQLQRGKQGSMAEIQ